MIMTVILLMKIKLAVMLIIKGSFHQWPQKIENRDDFRFIKDGLLLWATLYD